MLILLMFILPIHEHIFKNIYFLLSHIINGLLQGYQYI